MPSLKRGYIVAALVLIGVCGLAYSIVMARVLIGAGFLLSALIVAVLVYYDGAERHTLTRATIAVTVVYGVFTVQLLPAVVAACVVYLSAWLTGPDSPFEAPDTEIFPVRERLLRSRKALTDCPDNSYRAVRYRSVLSDP